MANAVFGYNNHIENGTLSTGSEVSGLNVSNLKIAQGSSATSWQTVSPVITSKNGAWFITDAGYSASWQAFLLARTSLTPSAQVRWRVGAEQGVVEEPTDIDLDFINGTPSTVGWTATRSGGAGTGDATYFDASGSLVQATANEWRNTYDPSTLAKLGLLWEPARTNHVRNPRALNASTWTVGTAPTGWAVSVAAGLSYQIVSTGTEGSTPYVDVRIFGTPLNSGFSRIYPASASAPYIVAATGETWTLSVGLKLVTGVLPTTALRMEEYNGTAFLRPLGNAADITVTYDKTTALDSQIKTITGTAIDANTTRIRPMINFNTTFDVPVDFTVRVGKPQALKSGVNYITNSTGTGAVAGSRGTLPTNWIATVGTNVNYNVVGIGTENGMPYIDFRVTGSSLSSTASYFAVYPDSSPTASIATNAQYWSYSHYHKLLSADVNSRINRSTHFFNEFISGGVDNGQTSKNGTIPNAIERLSAQRNTATFITSQPDGGATVAVRTLTAYYFNAGALDLQLRISCPQLEQGECVTSPILPAPASSSTTTLRRADSTNRSLPTALSNYTLSVEGVVTSVSGNLTTSRDVMDIRLYSSVVTAAQLATVQRNTSNILLTTGYAWNPTTTFAGIGGKQVTLSTLFRFAIAQQTNDASAYTDGVSNTFYSSMDEASPLDKLSISSQLYGVTCISRLRVYPKRLTDGQLTALTTNGSTLDPSVLTYDSGMSGAGVLAGYGQSFCFSPTAVLGRYCRCDIDDASNPDGYIVVGLAYAGPVWQPEINMSWESSTGADAKVDEVVTRGGQEYPQYRYEQRRWDVAYDNLALTDMWSHAGEVARAGRRGANVLFVPDPTGNDKSREAVFGRATSLADFAYSSGQTEYRTWRVRVTERL